MKSALLVGGTAATGVAISAELRARGYEVTIYHRGTHEVAELLDLEHIHGDPHQLESITQDLRGRSWDVTVATYGRIRQLATVLSGRTGHFLSISGMPVVSVLPGVPLCEEHRYVTADEAPLGLKRLRSRIVETEEAVLEGHRRKDFIATVVRYPYVYGPYSVVPMEWHVIQRVLDRRQTWLLHSGGLALGGRCAAPNAARLVDGWGIHMEPSARCRCGSIEACTCQPRKGTAGPWLFRCRGTAGLDCKDSGTLACQPSGSGWSKRTLRPP